MHIFTSDSKALTPLEVIKNIDSVPKKAHF